MAGENIEKGLDVGLILALALGGYLIYRAFQSTANTVADNPVTQATSSAVASVIANLTMGSPMQVNGSLYDPNGNFLGAISNFPAATGNDGNTYLQVGGTIYQLTGSLQNGNYTGTPVGSASSTNAPGSTLPNASAYSGGATGGTGLTQGAVSFFSP
jgi:hypothetical protein